MKSLTALCAALLLLAGLAGLASCKDPCSKDWLRFMVVSACGMDKRHLARRKPSVAPSLKEILREVDQEFDAFVHGGELAGYGPFEDNDNNYEPAATEGAPVLVDARDKDVAVNGAAGFFTRLFEHPDQVLAEAWMGLAGTEPKRVPRRRAIQNAISRCCSEDCDEGDFDGVCD